MQRMLGNAVPALMAEILAREIKTQLLDQQPQSRRLKLLPPKRSDVPDPEPIAPVPQKYHHLIGEHAPHPGTGRGRMALQRAEAAE